jgi:diacylglycerol kinase family enzyme
MKPHEISISTAKGTTRGEFLWAEASTIGMVGPRLPLVDADHLSDGLIAFGALPADERETFVEYLEHRLAGSAPARTGLVSDRFAEIELRWEGYEAHLDGRLVTSLFVEPARAVRLSAEPNAVRVLRFVRPE